MKDEEEKEESEVKKLKKEEQLVMTGLTDVQIRERMGEVVGEAKDEDLGEVFSSKMQHHKTFSSRCFSLRLIGRRWQSTKGRGTRRRTPR